MRNYLLMGHEPYAVPILRPLQQRILAGGGRCAWFFHGRGAHLLRADEPCLADARAVMDFKPDAVVTPGNWVPYFFPGIKVEIFHGFGVAGKENNYRIRGMFDLYCTHGASNTPQFQALADRLGHFAVKETGWPKLDPLFDPAVKPLDVPRDRPVVLYASTFTQRLSSAPLLLDTVRRLAASGRWRWLVTLHPKMDPQLVRAWRALEGEHLRYVETEQVIPFLKSGDVMLCDTSSILMEFLTQIRPVVTFRNGEPGPHLLDVADPAQVEGALERALSRPAELMRQVESYATAIHPYRDGRSSERVLSAIAQFIDEDAAQRLRRKPFNLGRKLQAHLRLRWP